MTSVVMKKKKKKNSTVFINIGYLEEKGEHLLKKCFEKLGRSSSIKVNFVCRYSVTKVSFFTNMIDKLNILSKSIVIYHFSCTGCESSYTGKTERTFFKRTKEHVVLADSAIKGNLDNCSNVQHFFSINNLILNDVNANEFMLNFIFKNTRIFY